MDVTSKVLRRVERESGIPDLISLLADRIAPADLSSILMEVSRRRADRKTPAEVLAEFESNRFCAPADTDPRRMASWEQILFATLPRDFTPLELSPVCPLGSNSTVATVSQHKSLATIRSLEIVSDASNVLALACASRRRKQRSRGGSALVGTEVRLAASHRLLRTQFYSGARSFSHFRLFHLVTAGRDRGTGQFESASIVEHLLFYLGALRQYLAASVPVRVQITDFTGSVARNFLAGNTLPGLRRAFPDVEFAFDQQRASGRGYYTSLCFKLHVHAAGEWVEIGDGGDVNWTSLLLSDAKERLFISAIGSERVVALADDRSPS